MTHSFQDCVYLPRYLYYLIMKRCVNNSNFKLRTEKSLSLQFINEMEISTSTNLHGSTLLPWIKFVGYIKNYRSATQRINCYWYFTIGDETWRHLDLLTMVRFSPCIKTSVYTLFGKNKIKFGQKFFASPKILSPVRLCFLQIFIFPQLFNAPVWWRPNAVVRDLFLYLRLISIAFV